MWKTVCLVGFLLGSVIEGKAGVPSDGLAARVARAAAQALTVVTAENNRGAMKNHQMVQFRVWDYEHFPTHAQYIAYDIGCKAYVLDSHWLIVSSACIQAQNELISDTNVYVEGHTIAPLQKEVSLEEGFRFSLLWHPKPVYVGPFVKVLATFSPEQLIALGDSGYTLRMNTSRLGLDVIRRRSISGPSILGNLFHLETNVFQVTGTALDPLFVTSPEQSEFLVAYNAGYVTYKAGPRPRCWRKHKSSAWYSLDKYDLEFIQKTVLQHRPQDWLRFKQLLFYNQTHTPYFR